MGLQWFTVVYSVYNYGVLNKGLKVKMVGFWHLPTWHQCSNICQLYISNSVPHWVAEATSGASSATPYAGYVGGLRLPVSETLNTVKLESAHIRFLHGIWRETQAADEHDEVWTV